MFVLPSQGVKVTGFAISRSFSSRRSTIFSWSVIFCSLQISSSSSEIEKASFAPTSPSTRISVMSSNNSESIFEELNNSFNLFAKNPAILSSVIIPP